MRRITPYDVKKYSRDELNALCAELRGVIFDTVMQNGGHLASNLGAIEATVAMCRVFDFPNDKIIFDVGHQCYAYKLLTGRGEEFSSLRKKGGISGFPKRAESEYDSYDTGHAGTAISAALGLAKARDLTGGNQTVIAFIGDGSFNNGLVYEALNSLNVLKTNVLIVLNDNGMSISPTVGGMHQILTSIRSDDRAEKVRLLESFSLKYVGVKDGNDLDEMLSAFQEAKSLLSSGSVLLHVSTKKGKGYAFSEEHPSGTHGVAPGKVGGKEYSDVLGETLTRLANTHENICAVTAAMTDSLGLAPFFAAHPDKAFDVGICEEHACVLSAAMATAGLKPYYAVYSTFLQRSFDEIIHDVCAQNLPVTFCVDRAGISGRDGETHQGVFDLSYLSFIPNLTVACPKDVAEFEKMLIWSAQFNAPLAIRYPRCGIEPNELDNSEIVCGKWQYLHTAQSPVVVFAVGERCIRLAQKIRKTLVEKGLDFSLVNARFIKPMDTEILDECKDKIVVTIEDNVLLGGFGEKVCAHYTAQGAKNNVRCFGYKDAFIEHGAVEELCEEYGVSEGEILAYLSKVCAYES